MISKLEKSQRLLLGHGALVLLFGFLIGFGFLFFLLGKIELWPFGAIEYQMPGTYDAWRMAHIEGILNGLMMWILAAVMPILSNYIEGTYRLAVGSVIVGWTIAIASVLDPLFPESRGLAFTKESGLISDIAFFLFIIGIGIVIWLVTTIAVRSFRAAP
jgi:hypothetical protein